MLSNIEIDSRYLVTDTGTSDGTQIKYYFEGKWYKVDRYGGEGEAEALASKVMELSDFDSKNYVHYDEVMINGERGCVSEDFLKPGESFITLYRLHSNITGQDPAAVTSKMDYDDAIDYIVSFVKNNIGLDIREYLANTMMLDSLILNEDRHFNNYGLILSGDKPRTAPIFDNGKSLFVGNPRYDSTKTMSENRKIAFAKAFSGNFTLNKNYLKDYRTLNFDKDKIRDYLRTCDLQTDSVYSRLYKLIAV